jgi:very-short-patch-repair endonuclease
MGMTIQDTPQALAAERQRRAAARARAYRQRARDAITVDAAIADALAASLARVRRGLPIDAFIIDLATEARLRLKAAGIAKPASVFKQRVAHRSDLQVVSLRGLTTISCDARGESV